MNLLNNKKVLIDLLKHADVLNTLNGGHVQTDVQIRQKPYEFEIEILAPNVDAEAFNILLDFHKLIINITSTHPAVEAAVQHPIFVRSFHLPGYVDSDHITARYEDGRLVIRLPFRKLTGDQRRRIRIEHL